MAIYDIGDKVEKWRYDVKEVHILYDNKTIEIPTERVMEFTITHNYINNLYPIFQIKIVMSSDTFYEIEAHKNDIKFHLRIDKYFFYEDKTSKADGSIQSVYKSFLNDTFDIIMDDGSDNLSYAIKREENKSDYGNIVRDIKDDWELTDNGLTFYLYKTINSLKKNVNKIFTGVNVTDSIAYLMSQANINNVIMQQPDNAKIYDTFVIPPLSISKALYWIDTYYGLYKYGTIFYCDFDYFYIIPFDSSKRTAFLTNEIKNTNLIVPISSSAEHSKETGVLKKEKDKKSYYIICNKNLINTVNGSISNDLINGSDSISIDSFSGKSEISSSNALIKTADATQKVFTNNTENPFYSSMQTALAKSLSLEVSIVLMNYDIDMLKPNKNFSLLFEDSAFIKKYNGKYTLISANHTFTREGESFAVYSEIQLRKM